MREECETKLGELVKSPSATLQIYARQSIAALDEIAELPWVLTHDDLSNMNLLVDVTTGHLQGVIDWADAGVWPFGVALWGVESILGYTCPDGWIWLDDGAQSARFLFSTTLQKSLDLSAGEIALVEKARILGLLLRYGFVWRNGVSVPAEDNNTLEKFLESKYTPLLWALYEADLSKVLFSDNLVTV
jgi:hypothetical protein